MSALITTRRNPNFDELDAPPRWAANAELAQLAAPAARKRPSSPSSSDRPTDAPGRQSAAAQRSRRQIEWARESCPADTTWEAINWNDLYGD